ncbi:MAG: putative signal transducing protein [Janthinobacterium lividum]
MQANIIVLDSYYEPLAAHLARTKLEAAGIPCFLTNENLVSLNRMYSPVAGGVRLHVYQRDAAQAAEVLRDPPVMQAVPGGLAEPAAEGSQAPGAPCPRCGSHEVTYDAAAEPGRAHWFVALLSRLRRYPLQGRAHHCFHCGLNY